MKNDVVFKKNPDVVTRKIDEETILVPIFRTSEDLNCIYTLNESAAKVWDMIDGKNSVADIKQKTLKEFNSSPKEIDKQLAALLKDLNKIKAVI